MKHCRLSIALLLTLGACNADVTGQSAEQNTNKSGQDNPNDAVADQMGSNDPLPGKEAISDIRDSKERPMMQLQVVLDRLGFTPGVVDGEIGSSTRNAISGFQEANDLDVTGNLDSKTRQLLSNWSNIPATRVVTIPAQFANEPFIAIPEDPAQQAKLERLGYASLDEKLAERFHTTIEILRMLNPDGKPAGMVLADSGTAQSPSATGHAIKQASGELKAGRSSASAAAPEDARAPTTSFRAGQKIRVPNIGADKIVMASKSDEGWVETLRSLGVGSEQPKAAKVVVSKSAGTLKVFSDAGKLIGMYTATMGSGHDPLPLGNWKVLGVAHNPPFAYNPELFWDVPDQKAKQSLPPGPNGPVGVVWIDLSKEHYGIHGTPNPETIGRAQSHGCVRLTNWDAARLAQMVSSGTKVLFES